MSIITRGIDAIIKWRIKVIMKDFIQPILDTVLKLIQPKQGTKFLVTVAGLGGLIYLAKLGLLSTPLVIAIAVIVGLYYISDLIAKVFCKPQEDFCECEPEDEEIEE